MHGHTLGRCGPIHEQTQRRGGPYGFRAQRRGIRTQRRPRKGPWYTKLQVLHCRPRRCGRGARRRSFRSALSWRQTIASSAKNRSRKYCCASYLSPYSPRSTLRPTPQSLCTTIRWRWRLRGCFPPNGQFSSISCVGQLISRLARRW